MAKDTTRRLYHAALSLPESRKEERTRIERHARASEDVKNIKAMLECARNEQGITISANEFDTDPWLLNCNNGTLALHTGDLRPHRREDLITKMCPVRFDKKGTCPLFMNFLETIFKGDKDLLGYMQRVFGYALTGTVGEKALFCCYGDGNNGKTTKLEAFRYVMGDYAGQIMIESLLNDSAFHRSTALADLADLRGARFVTTSEADQGAYLAEAQIKQLTGTGQIKTCRKYENPVEFPPTFKIFMDSNYKLIVRGRDRAIWNRLKLIPFNVTIPSGDIDKNLLEKLKGEASGILRWAVEGCLEWQRTGLNEPPQVTGSVKEWHDDSDPFGDFFEIRCGFKADAMVASARLYAALEAHCEREGIHVKQNEFTEHLRRLGCQPDRTNTGRFWRGIRLKGDTGDGV
jgi:putative DNA primase/helicase